MIDRSAAVRCDISHQFHLAPWNGWIRRFKIVKSIPGQLADLQNGKRHCVAVYGVRRENSAVSSKVLHGHAGLAAIGDDVYRNAKVSVRCFHRFATLSLKNGVDVKPLSSTLRHYSAGFAPSTYIHTMPEMMREAADTMWNVIGQAI
ncbi:MAG: hypothetical protein SPF38_07785 [Dysosmobacter sp.]|nr:hypothetical protein [Dysosmobacter sp.]